jgi:hypothetical protein
MLPEENEIPMTTYEMKQTICPLGMEVEKIMFVRTTASCSTVTLQISLNAHNMEPLDTNEGMTGVMRKGCTELLGR